MENLKNLPPFYIGQKVVCVERPESTSSRTMIDPGKTYIVDGVKKCYCGCGNWLVSVGIPAISIYRICSKTENTFIDYCGKMYFSHLRFTPIQEQKFPLISLSKVIEKERELVSAN